MAKQGSTPSPQGSPQSFSLAQSSNLDAGWPADSHHKSKLLVLLDCFVNGDETSFFTGSFWERKWKSSDDTFVCIERRGENDRNR
jgi:hypothetical protein